MLHAYFTGKSLFRPMALVLCFCAFLSATLGNLRLLVLAILGLFGLLTWLASP